MSESVIQDISALHGALQSVMKALNLPGPPPLVSAKQRQEHQNMAPMADNGEAVDTAQPFDSVLPSCDNSPRMTAEDEGRLAQVPIHSVYRLTKLSALRSPDGSNSSTGGREGGGEGGGRGGGGEVGHGYGNGGADQSKIRESSGGSSRNIDDLISRGQLGLEDAERLFRLYMDYLDHFMYGIGGRHKTLEELRRSSRVLAVCIFTVAALHDGQRSSILYGTCMKELRRLMSASLFDRRIDRDQLRAMCIASYWLSDISWTVSGHAIRRAAELNLARQHQRAVGDSSVSGPGLGPADTAEMADAADAVRIWYILYICDQHLSTLYARQPVLRDDDASLRGWEAFLQSPVANDEDKRLTSQVALLNIMHNIRELFGPDLGEPVPTVYVRQMASFSRQLDKWLARWSAAVPEHHDRLGGFPRQGVLLHYHFASLHLHSQVFRGLVGDCIPPPFYESACAAVAAASAIVHLLISDPEIQTTTLAGMPAYMHSMTAYACMFLAKLAMLPKDELAERAVVISMITRLISLYKATPVGRWHLIRLMADGLEKVVATLRQAESQALQTSNTIAATITPPPAGAFVPGPSPMPAHIGFPAGPATDPDVMQFSTDFLLDNNLMLGALPSLMYLGNSGSVGLENAADLSPSFYSREFD